MLKQNIIIGEYNFNSLLVLVIFREKSLNP